MKNPDLAGVTRNIQAEKEATNQKYLGNFDKNRGIALDAITLARQDKADARQGKIDERAETKYNQEQDLMLKNKDPKSAVSASKRAAAIKLDPKNAELYRNMSGEEIDEALPDIEKIWTVEQRGIENQFRREAAKEARDEKTEEKNNKKATLSERQVIAINEFDDTINKMNAVLTSLGNRTDWTGPIDGRTPSLTAGGEQNAFRANIGRMQDAYRKLVTGAGASNLELARLETRLPKPTDTYETFQAKARVFIKEVKKSKETHLGNI
jgi:hypothetical protein